MGGDADREAGGILCPSCFMLKAPYGYKWEIVQR